VSVRLVFVLLVILAGRSHAADPQAPTMIIAVGAAGEEGYEQKFAAGAEALRKACAQGGVRTITIGLKASETNSLELLKTAVREEALRDGTPLWIVLIGHGAFDGREAKFNLRGDDLSATDLAAWLKPAKRPLIVVNASASSAPFLQKLSAPGRVIITATRSGAEQNYAHFGEYFAGALTDAKADLDKDGQTSLLEAFLSTSRQTAEFFEGEGRLATEHALLDDNGDGFGTQADWFKGLRVVKKSKDGAEPDGLRAHQVHLAPGASERLLSPAVRAKRDELELALAKLRAQKGELAEADYYAQLEALLVKVAELYEGAAARAD